MQKEQPKKLGSLFRTIGDPVYAAEFTNDDGTLSTFRAFDVGKMSPEERAEHQKIRARVNAQIAERDQEDAERKAAREAAGRTQ